MGEPGLVDWYLAVLNDIEKNERRKRQLAASIHNSRAKCPICGGPVLKTSYGAAGDGGVTVGPCGDVVPASQAFVSGANREVLADIAAKRAIVADHKPVEYRGIDGPSCGRCESYMRYPCPTIRLLASAHADRRGYIEAWRPE